MKQEWRCLYTHSALALGQCPTALVLLVLFILFVLLILVLLLVLLILLVLFLVLPLFRRRF